MAIHLLKESDFFISDEHTSHAVWRAWVELKPTKKSHKWLGNMVGFTPRLSLNYLPYLAFNQTSIFELTSSLPDALITEARN